jgi:hypothetical protein
VTELDFQDTPATAGEDGTPWGADRFATVATVAAKVRYRATVHAATWSASRLQVIPVCTGSPAHWVARWTGPNIETVEVTCKSCRRALNRGRVRWAN